MAARSYGQYCGLAEALDVLGERWTLLVLRELLPGPRRFSDLLGALPGISTGLLTARLRSLQEQGAVRRRRLPPPAASAVYELTASGRELEPALLGLARWGVARLAAPEGDRAFRPRWAMIAMLAGHDPEAAAGVDDTYGFEVGDEAFHVRVADGRVEVRDGRADRVDVAVRTDAETLKRLAWAPASAREALRDGRLAVDGDPAAIARCTAILAPGLARALAGA